MIGLLGPADSVQLVLEVAAEEGIAAQIMARSYSHIHQTNALAKELNQSCQVILLTGRVPFAVLEESGLSADTEFISHSGADLYRTIASTLIERKGRMPRVSLDSIDPALARDSFADLGLPKPEVFPGPLQNVSKITEFHTEQLASGNVELVLTCLAEVSQELQARGLPVRRVTHTKASIRAALKSVVLTNELRNSRSAQPAAMLFRVLDQPTPARDKYRREASMLELHTALLDTARRCGGRLTRLESDLFSLAATRGVIELALERRNQGHKSILDLPALDLPLRAGVGIGLTVADADSNALKALRLGETDSKLVPVIFPDGRRDLGSGETQSRWEEADLPDSYVQLGAELKMGALAARRIINALRRLDPERFTARDLAAAYGVQARAARRLLNSLTESGLAEEIGVRARPTVGRPQTLYKVNLPALEAVVAASGQTP